MLPLSVTLHKTGININPYSIFTIVATKCKIYVYAYVYVELLISDTIWHYKTYVSYVSSYRRMYQ